MAFNAHTVIGLTAMFFLMLGLGVTVDLPHFKQHFQTPKGILIGLFSQFAAMPAIAYCISYLYDLQPLHKVALVMTGCCPGGAMSNILCFFARADLDLSIAMTTASSIGSVVLMPMNIFIYVQMTGLADEVKIDFVSIGLSAVVVVLGITCGVSLKIRATKKKNQKIWSERKVDIGVFLPGDDDSQSLTEDKSADSLSLQIAAALGMIGGVTTVSSGLFKNAKSDTPAWEESWEVYAAAFTQAFTGLVIGFSLAKISKLPSPSCVAVSIETSVQNAVIAMSIINITFAHDNVSASAAVVIPMCYSAFTSCTNFFWALIAMKLGLTELPKDFTIRDLLRSYIKSLTADKGENARRAEDAL